MPTDSMLMLWLHPPESQLCTFEDIFQIYKIGYTQYIFQTPLLVFFSNWVRPLYSRRMVNPPQLMRVSGRSSQAGRRAPPP